MRLLTQEEWDELIAAAENGQSASLAATTGTVPNEAWGPLEELFRAAKYITTFEAEGGV